MGVFQAKHDTFEKVKSGMYYVTFLLRNYMAGILTPSCISIAGMPPSAGESTRI